MKFLQAYQSADIKITRQDIARNESNVRTNISFAASIYFFLPLFTICCLFNDAVRCH
jgi:hypothetical protein